MSDKRWSDYWKKYKDLKLLKKERPTITITPRLPTHGINKQAIVFILLLIGVFGLSVINYRTGNYVNVLETNKTCLENELAICKNQTSNLSSNLTECSGDLDTCEDSLDSKTKSLSRCQTEKSDLSSEISDCKAETKTCSNDYKVLESDYDNLEDDYNDCEDSLDSIDGDYNELRNNLENYAAIGKCCPLNKTHYEFDSGNNRINCLDSGGTSITCS